MRAGAGSDTAIFTALQRAAHQILDDVPRILEDPVAVDLAPGSSEEAIRKAAAELGEPAMKLLRTSGSCKPTLGRPACRGESSISRRPV